MKVIVIAEAGVNHNGSLAIAKKLVDVAKLAKADYVKFQTFSPSKLVVKNTPKAKYQNNFNNIKEDQYKMLKKLELSRINQLKLIKYCKRKKINFLSTAFDIDSLKFLLKKGLDFIKIPSGEITNLPLLEFIRKKNKKILLSTGASSLKDIELAFKTLKKKGKNITILHCNSAYPTPIKDLNLNVLINLKKIFKSNVGLSDHSLSLMAPAVAVGMGATVIEKHFTLNRKMNGPDHRSSLEPKELTQMIKNIREAEVSMGNFKKYITNSEKLNQVLIRKSLVAKTFIFKGQKFNFNNITQKRPGSGISPMKIKKVFKKTAKKNFNPDEIIKI